MASKVPFRTPEERLLDGYRTAAGPQDMRNSDGTLGMAGTLFVHAI
jgi:hypothetical protein